MSEEPSVDDGQVFEGRRYPGDVDPVESHLYQYKIGGNEVKDLGWQGHMKIAHDAGLEAKEVEVIDSGINEHGMMYAAVKVTVVVDGQRFQSIQAADEATNQVRDPEYVFAVAESRAIKRAVKNALNIYPVDEEVDDEKHRVEEDVTRTKQGGTISHGDDGVDVEPPDGHDSSSNGDDGGFGI